MFNMNGFSHSVLLLAVVVLGAVGFAGWRVYDAQLQKSAIVVQQVESSTKSSEELQTAKDVEELEKELNATDLDSELDVSELDVSLDELQ